VVHVPVNAMGKKRSSVFFLPKLLLSLICLGPRAVLVANVKSGALVPTASGMSESSVSDFDAKFSIGLARNRSKEIVIRDL
jgi:hypothetical protein